MLQSSCLGRSITHSKPNTDRTQWWPPVSMALVKTHTKIPLSVVVQFGNEVSTVARSVGSDLLKAHRNGK